MRKISIMRKIVIIMAVVLSVSAFTGLAFADELATYRITGTHRITGSDTIITGRHTFVLRSDTDAPMPEGTENGVKKVTISSGETFDFGEISYGEEGTYDYTVSREPVQSKDLIEDSAEYMINVCVSKDGTKTVLIKRRGSSGKTDDIVFTDRYVSPEKGRWLKPVKTGDETAYALHTVMLIGSLILLIILIREHIFEHH